MIERIKTDKMLKPYVHQEIADEGIEISIDSMLKETEYVGIKVDEYYMGQHDATPPKAVDYIVSVDCSCDCYVLYILELKNVHAPKNLKISEIQEKFTTTIEDFIKKRFFKYFLDDRYRYKKIELYVVGNAYKDEKNFKNHAEYLALMKKLDKKDSLRVERNLGSKIYRIRKQLLTIKYDIPPNPVIRKIT